MVPEERALVHASNPMCEAFPRIAACEYVRYGSGGREDTRSAICILGLNMINDKVSFFLKKNLLSREIRSRKQNFNFSLA